jgi:hypothetical protein
VLLFDILRLLFAVDLLCLIFSWVSKFIGWSSISVFVSSIDVWGSSVGQIMPRYAGDAGDVGDAGVEPPPRTGLHQMIGSAPDIL